MEDEKKVPAAFRVGNRLFEGMVNESFAAADVPFEGLKVQALIGKDKQTDEFELTEVSTALQDEMVEAMLFGESISKTVPLGNHHSAVFRVYDINELLRLAELPADFKAPAKALTTWDHTWDKVRTLAGALESYCGMEMPTKPDPKDASKQIKDIEACEDRVRKFKDPVLNYLFDEWTLWKADLRRALTPGVVGGVIKKS